MKFIKIFEKPTNLRGNDLLLLVKQIILDEPNRIAMEVPQVSVKDANCNLDRREFRRLNRDFASCGTVGCVAGWGDIAVEGGMYIEGKWDGKLPPERVWYNVEERAREYFELDHFEAENLFYLENWPEDFEAQYDAAKDEIERAKVVANRIDFFIKNRY